MAMATPGVPDKRPVTPAMIAAEASWWTPVDRKVCVSQRIREL